MCSCLPFSFFFFFFFFFLLPLIFTLVADSALLLLFFFFLSLSLSKRPCGHVITSKKLGCLKREISRRLSREGVDLRTYVGKILWMRR